MPSKTTNGWTCCGASTFTGFEENPDAPYKGPSSFYAQPLPQRTPDNPFGVASKNKAKVKTIGEQFLEQIDRSPYPNHMFSVVLNDTQYSAYNYAWPKLLAKRGFVPVCGWQNSVHPGRPPLFLFILARQTASGGVKEPFRAVPPKWEEFVTASDSKPEVETKAAA